MRAGERRDGTTRAVILRPPWRDFAAPGLLALHAFLVGAAATLIDARDLDRQHILEIVQLQAAHLLRLLAALRRLCHGDGVGLFAAGENVGHGWITAHQTPGAQTGTIKRSMLDLPSGPRAIRSTGHQVDRPVSRFCCSILGGKLTPIPRF